MVLNLTEIRKVFKRISLVRTNIGKYKIEELNNISKNIYSFSKNVFTKLYDTNAKMKGQIRRAKNECLRETDIETKRVIVIKQLDTILKLEKHLKWIIFK